MVFGRNKLIIGGAAALPLVGFIGLGAAQAGISVTCGPIVFDKTCSPTGASSAAKLYQVPWTIVVGGGSTLVTCLGGPSRDSMDSALHDNVANLLIAQAAESNSGATAVALKDSTGRLVGYSVSIGDGSAGLGTTRLTQHLTCINDH